MLFFEGFVIIELVFPILGVSVVCEVFVPHVGKNIFIIGSFYRTPVPFGSSGDFHRIGKETVYIATVETVNFLDDIEIIQKPSIIGDKITSFYFWYAIEWKGYVMIDGDKDIQDNRRDDHGVNKGKREKMTDIFGDGVSPCRNTKGFVSFANFFEKYDFLFSYKKSIFFGETSLFFSERFIELVDFFENISYF